MRVFQTVLVANRGEIARRIIRTLDELGIESVAVYSEGDADAPYVREATRAVCIGPDPATESYLRVVNIIEAALTSGAQAIHPGYGFLSESPELAKACEDSGIVFIGPHTHALEVMGDKVRSRDHLEGAGVPLVPGFTDTVDGVTLTDADIVREAEAIGFPLLVKPSAGGGGKGMEVVRDASSLPDALAQARRLATSAFGDDTLLIERLIERPRHIEVQVFGTSSGEMLSLGERECTLQRRHQKVVEESPHAGGITPETVHALELAAVRVAASVQYTGAGTVEFLVDADHPDEFYFIEMNTRLQVEHPVTELVLGVDLVEMQVRTAAGENVLETLRERGHHPAELADERGKPEGWRITGTGHSVEARVYAESPEREFLPSTGRILWWDTPEGVRIDAAVAEGDEVSGSYDPMIAKVITHGKTRAEAFQALGRALADTTILGVHTNVRFLRSLISHERVLEGDLDTGLIETMLPFTPSDTPTHVLEAVAREFATPQSWEPEPTWAAPVWQPDGGTTAFSLRTGQAPRGRTVILVDDAGKQHEVAVSDTSVTHANPVERRSDVVIAAEYDSDLGHEPVIALWAGTRSATWRFAHTTRRARTLERASRDEQPGAGHCEAAMPGTVTRIHVDDGARVEKGDALVSIEAMKMEHPTRAPHAGTARIHVAIGDRVRRGHELASVTPGPLDITADTPTKDAE